MKKLQLVILLCTTLLIAQANTNTGGVDISNESTATTDIAIEVSVSPNPVVEIGELQFTLLEDSRDVFIFIANSAGKIVNALPIGATKAGKSSVILNVDGLKGFYVVGVKAANQTGTCKMFVK